VNLIELRGGDHSIGGTLFGLRGEPRIVMVDDHSLNVPPARHMLVVRNEDRPGMVRLVSGALAEAEVNIDDMAVGHSPSGAAALMLFAIDQPVPPDVVARLRASGGIVQAHALSLE